MGSSASLGGTVLCELFCVLPGRDDRLSACIDCMNVARTQLSSVFGPSTELSNKTLLVASTAL